MNEYQLQSAVFDYISLMRNKDWRWWLIVGTNNEGAARNKRLQRQGTTKGLPDIICFLPTSFYRGLAIEHKTVKGRLSKSQQSFIAKLHHIGWKIVVSRSVEESLEVLNAQVADSLY